MMHQRPITVGDTLTDHLNLAVTVAEHITDGGMGEIYICHDQHGRMLALKTPRRDGHADTGQRARRFAHEALIWLRLWPHPNIIRTHFVTIIQDRPFLVLDYADGGSVQSHLDGMLPSLDQRLLWAQQIIAGIVALHTPDRVMNRLAIIHHDLKPENILIKDNVACITDFGLTSLLDESAVPQTLNGVAIDHVKFSATEQPAWPAFHPAGTPRWIAPELWEGVEATTAADMYVIGLILSSLLAGRYAYAETTPSTWADIHRTATPQSLCEADPQIPSALDELYRDLLKKSPEERPTAEETQRRFRQALRETQRAIWTIPQDLQSHSAENVVNRGVILARTTARFREFDAAAEAISISAEMAPENIDVIITQGLIAKGMHAYTKASATLCRALHICHTEQSEHDKLLIVYNYLAGLFSDTSQFREADYFYQQMSKQRDNLAVVWFNRAINAARWSKQLRLDGRHESAQAMWDEGLMFASTANTLSPASEQIAKILQYLIDSRHDGPPRDEVLLDDVMEVGARVQYVIAEDGIAPLVTNMTSNLLGSYTIEHNNPPIERIDFK